MQLIEYGRDTSHTGSSRDRIAFLQNTNNFLQRFPGRRIVVPRIASGQPKSQPAELLHQFKFARFPRLVEPRLQRTIKSQEDVPAFAGDRLYPIGLMAIRRSRTEPDID
jgi:hypothetical protein